MRARKRRVFYDETSCPARRCSGTRAPLNFVASLLCMAPLSFVASFLCSAQLCRFAPVAPLSFLASRVIPQPTENPIEKLCSALNFCWLGKRSFSNDKAFTLLVTSSPGGSLPCFSRSSPWHAQTCLFSVQSVSLFQPLSRWFSSRTEHRFSLLSVL